MSREKLEERKAGLKLLQGLGEATAEKPLRSMVGEWCTGTRDGKIDLVWYRVKRYDPDAPIGQLLKLLSDMLAGVGCHYQINGSEYGYDQSQIGCAIFFDPAEVLDDEELWAAIPEEMRLKLNAAHNADLLGSVAGR